MATITVKDGGGNPVTINALPALGAAADVGALPVSLSNESKALLSAIVTTLGTPAQAQATTTTKGTPYTAAAAITPGTAVTAGRAVLIACTTAGNQALKLSGGTTIIVPVAVGASILDNFAITDAPTSGTTATATVTVLS